MLTFENPLIPFFSNWLIMLFLKVYFDYRYPSIVADSECFELLGPKPKLFQECNENATCPKWFTGPWKPVSLTIHHLALEHFEEPFVHAIT